MADASMRIVIRGGSEALSQLQGIKKTATSAGKEAAKAAKDMERAQKAAAAESAKAAKAAEKASERAAAAAAKSAAQQQKAAQKSAAARARAEKAAAEAAAREAAKSSAAVQSEADKQAAHWQRMAQKSADARIKAERAVTAAAAREAAKRAKEDAERAKREEKNLSDRSTRRRNMAVGAIGAVTGGILAGGREAGNMSRGVVGVKSVQDRIATANEFRERLMIVTGDAGLTPQQRDETQSKVLAASTATGTDAGALLGALETGQAQFNDLKFFANNIGEIAKIAKASGSDPGEFAKALGTLRQAFGLSEKDTIEAAYAMKAAAAAGSIEMKDFAGNFAPTIGVFAQSTKLQGMEGVRQFFGASQGIGTGQFGGAESATRMERFISDLSEVDVMKEAAKVGIKQSSFTDESGKIDVGKAIEAFATNKQFAGNASVRQEIFKDIRGRQGIESLMAARERAKSGQAGAVDFSTFYNADASVGRKDVATRMQQFSGEGFFAMQQEAARMQAESFSNLKENNDNLLTVASAMDRLEQKLGTFAPWVSSAAQTGIGAVVGSQALTMLKRVGAPATAAAAGAEGAAAGAGGAGVMATLGGTVAGASAAAIAATAAAGLALGGAAGYAADEGTKSLLGNDKSTSEMLGDWLFEAVNGSAKERGVSAEVKYVDVPKTQRELVDATRETNRKLDSINSGLRAMGTSPTNAGAREPR